MIKKKKNQLINGAIYDLSDKFKPQIIEMSFLSNNNWQKWFKTEKEI